MRKAQIKGSLLKNQNVNKVCEDLWENDREFKAEFGRQYLAKLYSHNRDPAEEKNSQERSPKLEFDEAFF